MSRDEIAAKLRPIVAEVSGVPIEKITDDASLSEDLDLDSLDIVELVMEVEDGFDVTISDDEAEKLTTVGDAIELIEKLKS